MHLLVRHGLAVEGSRKRGSLAFQLWMLNIVWLLFIIETTSQPQFNLEQWLTETSFK